MAILPAYERGCRHGAPSRARCRERRDTARRVEAVEKLGEALDGVLATGDAVDAASLEVLLRRFEPAAHPEALLVAQAMTIDALAAGRPEAGRHFAVARAIRLALGACGGSDKFRAAAATTGLAVAGSVAARCAEEFVGVPCGCLGRLPRPARRPWERAKSEAARLFAAGRVDDARGHYIAAADGLSQELAPPATAEDGRNAGLASLCALKGGDAAGALDLAARSVQLAPHASKLWARLGAARFVAGDAAGAALAYENALDREAAVAGAGSKDAAVFAKLKRDAENAAAAAPAAVAPAPAAPRDAAALVDGALRCEAVLSFVSERGLRALAAAAGALRPVSDRGRRALRCRAMLRYSVGVHRDGKYLSVADAARAYVQSGDAQALAPARNALYLGALLRCDAVPRFDGAARLEQLLEVPLQEASKRSWLPGETERLVRADAVAGLLAVAAEQPHGDAREVSLRLLRNLTAAWASAFAEDRARTYDFLESQGLAVTDLKEAPTVMAAHGPLVDLYNEHLARLPHDPRPKTLAKWRWGLARVVVRGGLRDTRPKALAKLAAFGFAAAATLVEGPEAGDAGLLALFADLGVLLEHVARYRPRGFLANLRDNDECIADFLDDCKRRRALLPAALTALAAWGRDRGLSERPAAPATVGEIKLVTDPAGEDAEDKGKLFSIHLNDRDYLLKAVDAAAAARWVEVLNQLKNNANTNVAEPKDAEGADKAGAEFNKSSRGLRACLPAADALGRGLAAAVAPPPADAGDACAPPSQLSSALMDRAWAAAVAKLALAEVDDCEPSLLADALRHLVVAGGLAGEVRGALEAARAGRRRAPPAAPAGGAGAAAAGGAVAARLRAAPPDVVRAIRAFAEPARREPLHARQRREREAAVARLAAANAARGARDAARRAVEGRARSFFDALVGGRAPAVASLEPAALAATIDVAAPVPRDAAERIFGAGADCVSLLYAACACGDAATARALLEAGAARCAPAPFGDVFGTPLEVCEESGDEAAAAAVRRYAGGARTSLDADDVADFALLRAARRDAPPPPPPPPGDDGDRASRPGLWDAAGLGAPERAALDRLQAKFFRRREACLRRREPELWRRYREWELSEAGTWWHMSLA
ncbi:hypothetical protein AURANDRAFT_65677 [Aureococcus anophagefferens]|uniref:PH domain-containing protein n=1 Tax=Aureococcus anophagefferens TaxID=44056 RepID=F0YES6_AURAN|nr:hypothetical protein AURANDRAFT_65677 [Aureococcus anophagefferens]EGB06422.1 hypothetical protein AURANDRAFT_65677 [Aureococcus anophagefferens]|eukprot:XP_009038995.1 hypothetical protein AURANDRAFT_65677 [Aureococcus anophagefferens]